jgi:hypothetical protein
MCGAPFVSANLRSSVLHIRVITAWCRNQYPFLDYDQFASKLPMKCHNDARRPAVKFFSDGANEERTDSAAFALAAIAFARCLTYSVSECDENYQ